MGAEPDPGSSPGSRSWTRNLTPEVSIFAFKIGMITVPPARVDVRVK